MTVVYNLFVSKLDTVVLRLTNELPALVRKVVGNRVQLKIEIEVYVRKGVDAQVSDSHYIQIALNTNKSSYEPSANLLGAEVDKFLRSLDDGLKHSFRLGTVTFASTTELIKCYNDHDK